MKCRVNHRQTILMIGAVMFALTVVLAAAQDTPAQWQGTGNIYYNSGNVGIGTTNPSQKLDVSGNANITGNIILPTATAGLVWGGPTGANYIYGDNSNNYIRFVTNNSNSLAIASGNVGIGTTSPGYKLDVTSNFRLGSDGTAHIVNAYPSITSSGTNYYKALDINAYQLPISGGVTESGYRIGLGVQGFVSDTNFAGTLGYQYGIWARHGSYAAAANSRINNSYGVYIDSLTTPNTTIDNLYGLYQSLTSAKNYFAGNVGIGTTSPNQKLEVNGVIRQGVANGISLGDDAGRNRIVGRSSGEPEFQFVNSGNAYANIGVRGASIGLNYASSSGPTNGAIIEGSVGIGVNNPGSYKLNVNGDANVTGNVTTSGSIDAAGGLKISGSPVTSSQWSNNSGSINYSGNVGIGTTSPSARLNIVGPASNAGIELGNTTLGGADVNYFQSYDRIAPGYRKLVFYTTTGGATTMVLDTSGQVGIGTPSPNQKLEVNGIIRQGVTNGISLGDDAGRNRIVGRASNEPEFQFVNSSDGYANIGVRGASIGLNYASSSGPTNGAIIEGSVGIGINNPGSYKLNVNGDANVTGNIHLAGTGNITTNGSIDAAGGLKINGSPVTSSQWSNNSGSINYSGNVGIGTTTPSARLNIVGPTNNAGIELGNTTLGGADVNYFQSYDRVAPGYRKLVFYTTAGGAATMVLDTTGNVGINNPNPTATLDVVGDIKASGVIYAKYQDVAEWVPSSEQLAAGTVVVLDSTKSNQVISSSVSYDTRVAGVISAQPGIALGEKSDSKVLVATTGRVKVKVDASKSPIHIGDLLVTSDVPGMAMKSEPIMIGGRQIHGPGTLIGKALEPLEKGSGEILVLLSLQ